MAAKIIFILLAITFSNVCCQKRSLYFVNLPNIIRVGTVENVAVFVENVKGTVEVELSVKDESGKEIWKAKRKSTQSEPAVFPLRIGPYEVEMPNNADTKQYVTVTAVSTGGPLPFKETIKVLLSRKSKAVFIQTDKPIYTPTQTVRFRIIPVDIGLISGMTSSMSLDIKNPDGKITERHDKVFSRKGYITKTIKLGDTPVIGNWTIEARFQGENSSAQFEVREYVLPRFSVKIEGPPFILETDESIGIIVSASYVYGRAVKGSAELSVGVINDKNQTTHIQTIRDLLDNGEIDFYLPKSIFQNHKSGIWFPDGDRLVLKASATEKASGQKETTVDTSIYFSRTPYRISYKRSLKFFKPGLPYEVQVDVTYPNKKPAAYTTLTIEAEAENGAGKRISITAYKSSGLALETDKSGKGKVTVDVPSDSRSLLIKAKLSERAPIPKASNKPVTLQVKSVARSKSGYILVRTPKEKPKVGSSVQVEAILTQKDVEVLHYMVLSRGISVHSGSLEKPGQIATIRFRVTAPMCPYMRIVAFYNGEETVADQVVVEVEEEFDHQVSITTAKEKYRPGDKTQVIIKGKPNSDAAILAVDKSVYLLRDSHRLNKKMVFHKLKKFDLGCGNGGGPNTAEVFENAGIIVLSNAGFKRRSEESKLDDNACWKVRNYFEPKRKRRSIQGDNCCKRGEDAKKSQKSCRVLADELIKDEQCWKKFMFCCLGGPRGRSILLDEEEDEDIVEDDGQVQFRSNFPETWLYGDVHIGDSGTTKLEVTVPDTITTWVLQAFAISGLAGLGVSESYETVAFKPFFVQLNLPYSVLRGEQVMMSATIFNYDRNRVRTKVYFKAGEGICYDEGPQKRSRGKIVPIEGNDAITLMYPILPTELGESNVSVIAYAADGGDAATRKLLVEPEGVEQVRTVSKQIDPSADLGNAQRLKFNVDAPKDAVPGSESATLFITGSVLGPIVTKLLTNANRALRNPIEVYDVSSTETYTVNVPVTETYTRTENRVEYFRTYSPSCTCNVRGGGCLRSRVVPRTVTATRVRQAKRTRSRIVVRQQERFVMRSIAPNVYVLRYLQKIGKLTDAVKVQGQGFIQESYQRLLGHVTPDGSFSMWGNIAGTLWLTAFTMINLEDASEFIKVDQTVICNAADFVLKSQNGNGSFLVEGETFSKGMMGGLKGDPAMTAFVIQALERADCVKQSTKRAEAIDKAESYLKRKLPTTGSLYDLALISYALAPKKSKDAYDSLKKAMRLWTFSSEGTVDPTITEAVMVEATGYLALACIRMNQLSYVKPLIKWLTEHKNAAGGFSSGQDTVVGLRALSEYASFQPKLSLNIEISSSVDTAFGKKLSINKRNALVQNEIEIPVGGDINIKATGIGLAEAQTEVHYNTPKAGGPCPFAIDVNMNDKSFDSTYQVDFAACTRYVGNGHVGMSVMEMGILTGFVPWKPSLEALVNESTISRYELGDRAIILYFKKMEKTDTCVTVTFKRAFAVEMLQPAAITVKDALDPSISCTIMYSPSSKVKKLEKMCKKGRCKCVQAQCPPCSPTKMRRHFCNRDYVARIKVKSLKKDGNWQVINAQVLQVFKGRDLIVARGDVELKLSKYCRCPKLRPRKEYLLMGNDEAKILRETTYVKELPNRKRDRTQYDKALKRIQDVANNSRC